MAPLLLPPPLKQNNIQGWDDQDKTYKRDALTWHMLRKAQGQPHSSDVAEMRRITRAIYHHAVKTIKRDSDTMRMQKMAEALVSNKTKDLLFEASQINGRNNILPTSVDDVSTDDDIVNLFADKYSNLYNIVPYDQCEINDIKCKIDFKLQNDVHQNDSVNVHDVVKAIHHL